MPKFYAQIYAQSALIKFISALFRVSKPLIPQDARITTGNLQTSPLGHLGTAPND
jgi:hypothetical protein